MKLTPRTALLCLVSASFPLVVACGSDSSGLFSTAGGIPSSEAGTGGTVSTSGGGTAHAGQNAGGTSSSNGGSVSAGGSSAGGGTNGGSGNAGTDGVAGTGTSTGGDGTSTGGMTGTAGSDAGGTNTGGSATAGTDAGGTNSGGTSSGGTQNGGSTNGGSDTGGTGGGGTGGSSGIPACPTDAPPKDGTACTMPTPDNCFYPGSACSCLPDGNGPQAGRKWSCFGSADKCPQDAVPVDNTLCRDSAGAMCPYSGKDYCVCIAAGGGEARWQCTGAAASTCPPTQPAGFCSGVRECAYAARECFCSGTASAWSCQ